MERSSNSHQPRIAIFGAGGFIGSHIVSALAKSGDYAIVAIDVSRDKLEDETLNAESVDFVKLDVTRDRTETEKQVQAADIVIDLVAYANPGLYLTHPIETVELDLFENLKIAQLCVKHDKYLVQFSTCEVYGLDLGRDKPFNEDISRFFLGPVNEQRWIYSCAKQMLERLIHAYGQKNGLNYVIIRPFNFVGPKIDYLIREREEGNPRVFSHFMSSLLLNKPLPLVDGGENRRSYTYIDDAMAAFVLIVRNLESLNRQIVNIGNPHNETSIRQLANLMIEIYNQETGLNFAEGTVDIPATEFYGEGYADCDRRVPDVSKLYQLGWEPRYDVESTFRATIRYYLENNELIQN